MSKTILVTGAPGSSVAPADCAIQLAGQAFFLFSVPHTIFRTVHLEHFTPTDAVVRTTGLIVMTLLLAIVFVAAGRLERSPVRS